MVKKIIFYNLVAWLLLSSMRIAVCYSADIAYTAMVMDIDGKAIVQRKSDKLKQLPLKIGDVLYPDDSVSVVEKSTLTINYYLSGRQEKWPENSKFTVGNSQTDNTPENVQVVTENVDMPAWPGEDAMGGYIARDAEKIDFPEMPGYGVLGDKDDMPSDK
jgi:hypothetical protein